MSIPSPSCLAWSLQGLRRQLQLLFFHEYSRPVLSRRHHFLLDFWILSSLHPHPHPTTDSPFPKLWRKGCDIPVPFTTGYSKDSISLHFVQSGVLIIAVRYTKKFLWWGLRVILINVYGDTHLEVSLILCLFSKMTVVGLPVGLMSSPAACSWSNWEYQAFFPSYGAGFNFSQKMAGASNAHKGMSCQVSHCTSSQTSQPGKMVADFCSQKLTLYYLVLRELSHKKEASQSAPSWFLYVLVPCVGHFFSRCWPELCSQSPKLYKLLPLVLVAHQNLTVKPHCWRRH